KELCVNNTLQEQRQRLIGLQGINAHQEAEYRGRALEREAQHRARATEMELAVFRSLAPETILALALKAMAENAAKVGNLTITSEVLASLLNRRSEGGGSRGS